MLLKYINFFVSYNLINLLIALLFAIVFAIVFTIVLFYLKKTDRSNYPIRANVVDHMQTGYIYLNLQEEIVDINDVALSLADLKHKDVHHKKLVSLNTPLFQFILSSHHDNHDSHQSVYTHKSNYLNTYYLIKFSDIFDKKNRKTGTSILITDVTELQYTLNQLEYIGNHDDLTGAYNRYYFQQQLEALETSDLQPIGVVVGDVNGLKYVNDSLGHSAGDSLLVEAAEQLFNVFPKDTTICRIGGDEFVVLLPKVNEDLLRFQLKQLENYKFSNHTFDYPVGLSLDYAIQKNKMKSLTQIFNEADANMYLKKLMIGSSTRDNNIQLLQKILSGKSIETSAHLNRTAHLAKDFAMQLQLDNTMTTDLILLSQLHDIGKTVIPDEILFKPDKLDEDEWKIMKTHSTKGSEIVQCSPSLKGVGHYILHHHEYYNGKGYPHQLRGEEIPFLSRIIAIIDSYDAMTSKRIYKEAISKEAAIQELERCMGSQFDPELCKQFIKMVS